MGDFIASIGASAVYDLLKTTIVDGIQHVNRLCHYERDVKILIKRLDILEKHREELITMVDSAKEKGDEIHQNVTEWLKETDKALSENRAKAKRASPYIIKFVFHPQEMIDEDTLSSIPMAIDDMIKRFVGFNGRISYPSPYLVKNYMTFEARSPILEGVMEKLRDPNVKIIGLHGMGGIGKTTLAKEIARLAKKEANLFDKVIMGSAVSQTPDYGNIQCEIAKDLGIEFGNHETRLTKARRLQKELSKQVKVLIILDDIWEQIDLFDNIGIHFGDDQKGCKILFTSRLQGLYRDRHVVEFALNSLEVYESKYFFRKVVGKTLENNPDFEPLVNGLVKECGGVPIVINIVASALQNAPSSKWRTYLNEMRNSASQNIDGMESKVIQSIRMSYYFLESEEAKSLLLLCSTFPEDELISDDDLLMYCVGSGLLKNVNKLEDSRDKVRTLIDILRKNSLLLPSDKSESEMTYHWVKLHDVIRDVLKSIALNKGLLSLCNDEELPEENLKDLLVMSLYYNANNLSKIFPCPDIFLHSGIGGLRVLKLQCVDLRSPPSSFSCLVGTLQTLCLNYCDLEDTAFLGSFKNLKCLDLSSSRFEKLSKQVGQLTRLQLLKLDHCLKLEVIEPDVISNLINLEELYMCNVDKVWENVSLTELKKLHLLNTLCIKIAASDNLLSKDLITSKIKRNEIIVGKSIHFCGSEDKADLMSISKAMQRNLASERKYLVFQNLEKMKLAGLRNLEKICDGEFAADSFSKLKVVEVSRCHSLKNIFPVSNIVQLKKIEVECCDMMEEIVFNGREDGTHKKIVFLKLQNLELHHLPNLIQFCKVECEHNIPSSSSSSLETLLPFFTEEVSFPNLEKLSLNSLDKVQMIWRDQVREVFYLSNLKYLTICDCQNMEVILVIKGAGEGSQKETILFPKLEQITLDSLSNLKSFYGGKDLAIGCPSLKSMILKKCQKLTSFHKSCTNEFKQVEEPFFNEKVSFASMEELELSNCDSVQMIWPNQLEEVSYMQNLKKLKLWKCRNLKYIFSLATARSLVQLEELNVQFCETIQEVLVIKEVEKQGSSFNETIVFPKLEILMLYSLSNLRSFSGRKCLAIKYPSLKSLTIGKCPRLKTFHRNYISSEFEKAEEALFNEKVSFPIFEEIYFNSPEMERILWLSQTTKVYYRLNIKKSIIYIRDCPTVKYLFDFALARSLVQLRKLSICLSKNMEEILVIKEATEKRSRKKTILFPKLEEIFLQSLSNLKSFSGGGKYLAIECPSLKSLTIRECPRLKTFHKSCTNEFERVQKPFFNKKAGLLNLEDQRWKCLLMSSFVSFQDLVRIEICGCHALINLMDCSTAKSLVHLQSMTISSCDQMTHVIVDNEGEMVFLLLKTLELYHLPKLESFNCGNSEIHFPSLEKVDVSECSNMENFSRGVVTLRLGKIGVHVNNVRFTCIEEE